MKTSRRKFLSIVPLMAVSHVIGKTPKVISTKGKPDIKCNATGLFGEVVGKGIFTPANTIEIGIPALVLFNGEELKTCFYADTWTGEVRFYDDPPAIDPESPDTAKFYTKFGNVKVILNYIYKSSRG